MQNQLGRVGILKYKKLPDEYATSLPIKLSSSKLLALERSFFANRALAERRATRVASLAVPC